MRLPLRGGEGEESFGPCVRGGFFGFCPSMVAYKKFVSVWVSVGLIISKFNRAVTLRGYGVGCSIFGWLTRLHHGGSITMAIVQKYPVGNFGASGTVSNK